MKKECSVYTIEMESRTEIGDKCIYDEKTWQKWEVTTFKDDEYFNIVVNVVEYPQTNAPEIRPIYKLFQSLNPILKQLHLRLTHQGELHSVVNQKEIEKLWNDAKETLLTEYADVKQGKKMIQSLDKSYCWIYGAIKQSLLHFILLSRYRKSEKFSEKLASVLNEGSMITFDLTRLRLNDNNITIQGNGKVDNLSKMRKMYNEQIRPFAQTDFQYGFSIKSSYTLDMNGNTQNIIAFIKEQSSEKYVHQKTVRFHINPKKEAHDKEIPD